MENERNNEESGVGLSVAEPEVQREVAAEEGIRAEAEREVSLTVAEPEVLEESVSESEPSEAEKYIEDIAEKSAADIVGGGRGRAGLIVMLVCTVFAAIAVIVYGVAVADGISRMKTPLSELLLNEVFGSGITTLGGTYVRPPLKRIPSQTVVEGETPGAAEQETVTEESAPAPGESHPVKEVDLSVSADDVFAMINETPYEPDMESLYEKKAEIPPLSELHAVYGASAPVVLILHTHGTESYLADGAETYDSAESFRSYDTEENIVAVGRVIAEGLRRHGIGVIHLETMFDAENYNSAYALAAEEIVRITEDYPSVSYVFDIHRDAMITAEGVNLKPTSPVKFDGGAVSQIMFVVGTDHAGSGHTGWEDNLSLALKMQKAALSLNSGIMRAVNLRSASFNEQYTKGSLLVEIGAAGSSLAEACRAGEIFAQAAAKVIKNTETVAMG